MWLDSVIPFPFPHACHTIFARWVFLAPTDILEIKTRGRRRGCISSMLTFLQEKQVISRSCQHTSIHLTARNQVTDSNVVARRAEKTSIQFIFFLFWRGQRIFNSVIEWYLLYREVEDRTGIWPNSKKSSRYKLNHPKVHFSFHTSAKHFSQHLNISLITFS